MQRGGGTMVHNRDHQCFFCKTLIEHTPKNYFSYQPQLHMKQIQLKYWFTTKLETNRNR